MTDSRFSDEIRRSVARSISEGTLLRVPLEAVRIGRLSGVSPLVVARDLAEAGIKAGINVEFGAPRGFAASFRGSTEAGRELADQGWR